MSAVVNKRSNRKSGKIKSEVTEGNFVLFAFIFSVIIGLLHSYDDITNFMDKPEFFMSNDKYMVESEIKTPLDKIKIKSWWFYNDSFNNRNVIYMTGWFRGSYISHKQEITKNECHIYNVRIDRNGIYYELLNSTVKSGKINKSDFENCLVRLIDMYSNYANSNSRIDEK